MIPLICTCGACGVFVGNWPLLSIRVNRASAVIKKEICSSFEESQPEEKATDEHDQGTNIVDEVMDLVKQFEIETSWNEKMTEKKIKAKERREEEVKRREELHKKKGAKKGGGGAKK
ncbi:unnamed protein product [Microthlaspi erraticum]|uniref:Uncharacterized protein n=1 Tax=Microthlaspi erraticum TaxID=1685480 RepID=A0A6D2JPP3_9BRAS|nr:unnamed protein product [Microthlaspi erraticum]